MPDIGGLLPVFVRDRYSGFEVKTFSELSDAEIEDYIERNAQAVRDVIAHAGEPDAALANHLVTAPLIMERAGVPFAVKVHGSDLSYTVIPELERFGPMARDGARAATGILVGSDHIAERLREAVDEPEVNAKVRLGPPGVDTELFAAIAREDGPRAPPRPRRRPGGGRGLAVRRRELVVARPRARPRPPSAGWPRPRGRASSSWAS